MHGHGLNRELAHLAASMRGIAKTSFVREPGAQY